MTSELDEIRQRKILELNQRMAQEKIANEQEDMLKKAFFLRFLTKRARQRLSMVKVAHPELAERVELALIQAVQSGGVSEINDEQLRIILLQVQEERKDFNIRRR